MSKIKIVTTRLNIAKVSSLNDLTFLIWLKYFSSSTIHDANYFWTKPNTVEDRIYMIDLPNPNEENLNKFS
jgi:hypothetical protein